MYFFDNRELYFELTRIRKQRRTPSRCPPGLGEVCALLAGEGRTSVGKSGIWARLAINRLSLRQGTETHTSCGQFSGAGIYKREHDACPGITHLPKSATMIWMPSAALRSTASAPAIMEAAISALALRGKASHHKVTLKPVGKFRSHQSAEPRALLVVNGRLFVSRGLPARYFWVTYYTIPIPPPLTLITDQIAATYVFIN